MKAKHYQGLAIILLITFINCYLMQLYYWNFTNERNWFYPICGVLCGCLFIFYWGISETEEIKTYQYPTPETKERPIGARK